MPARRVLIVGWGFLGSAVGSRLLALGLSVRGVGSSCSLRTEQAADDGAEMIIGRLDQELALTVLEGVDHVVYTAGGLVPGAAAIDPALDAMRTLLPTIALFEALREFPGVAVTYVSSGGTVYGDPAALPAREDAAIRPKSAYGVSRCAGELYARMYAETIGTRVQVVRCANVYGPGQPADRGQGLVAVAVDRIARGLPLTVHGDGRSLRDYVHVSDVADAIAQLVLAESEAGVINVGSGRGHTAREVLSLIEAILGVQIAVSYLPARRHDVRHSVLDISLLASIIDYRPRSLESGLAELLTARDLREVSDVRQPA